MHTSSTSPLPDFVLIASLLHFCVTELLTNSLNLLRGLRNENISQLAHASERSTASPLSAFSAQTLTASSRAFCHDDVIKSTLTCLFLQFFLLRFQNNYADIFFFAVKDWIHSCNRSLCHIRLRSAESGVTSLMAVMIAASGLVLWNRCNKQHRFSLSQTHFVVLLPRNAFTASWIFSSGTRKKIMPCRRCCHYVFVVMFADDVKSCVSVASF